MSDGVIYVIRNTKTGEYISNYKVALWSQTDKLTHAWFFPEEKNARTQAARLMSGVKKARRERDKAPDMGQWLADHKFETNVKHIDTELEVVPVTLSL